MTQFTHHVRRAMATQAEVRLFGDDVAQLDAVAEMAFDEIARVEQLLSRFDATSELSRINRDAAGGACLVDFELLQILSDCRAWWLLTEGAFDIASGSRDESGAPLTLDAVELDVERRLVSFRASGVRLDLGAYGKGYALDCVAKLMRNQGVTSALLDLGTSSLVAIGAPLDAPAWTIDLQNRSEISSPFETLTLCDAALSTSAVWHSPRDHAITSDLLDPNTGQPLKTTATCTVIAPTATTAEALSTAFVVMGRDRADALLAKWQNPSWRAIWCEEACPVVDSQTVETAESQAARL